MTHEELTIPSAPRNLVRKLAEVMGEIDFVAKLGRNEFQKYNYMRAADLAHAVRDKLSKRSIIMLSDVVEIRCYEIPAREGVMQAIDLKVKYTFYDGDSKETLSFHGYGTGTDRGDKAAYKAHTGALKYAIRNSFLVPDESDPEEEKTDKGIRGRAVDQGPKNGRMKKTSSLVKIVDAIQEAKSVSDLVSYLKVIERRLSEGRIDQSDEKQIRSAIVTRGTKLGLDEVSTAPTIKILAIVINAIANLHLPEPAFKAIEQMFDVRTKELELSNTRAPNLIGEHP